MLCHVSIQTSCGCGKSFAVIKQLSGDGPQKGMTEEVIFRNHATSRSTRSAQLQVSVSMSSAAAKDGCGELAMQGGQ